MTTTALHQLFSDSLLVRPSLCALFGVSKLGGKVKVCILGMLEAVAATHCKVGKTLYAGYI